MNRKTLYPADIFAVLPYFEVMEADNLLVALGSVHEEDGAFLIYATRDGRVEFLPFEDNPNNDIPTDRIFLTDDPEPGLMWAKENVGNLAGMGFARGSLQDLLKILEVSNFIQTYEVQITVERKISWRGEMEYDTLSRPQPENGPLWTDHNHRDHMKLGQGDSHMASTTPRKTTPRTAKGATTSNPTGIAKGHEFEDAPGLGLKQVQVWPARKQERGFLGFATLLYHDLTIRDIVVREAGAKSQTPGAIYGAMPAKKTDDPNRPYQEYCYFTAEKDDEPNKRDTFNAMIELAYLRAMGKEPALEEEQA